LKNTRFAVLLAILTKESLCWRVLGGHGFADNSHTWWLRAEGECENLNTSCWLLASIGEKHFDI
jgi:hypothetical protein